ncbi:MAG: glucosaminidase domain-containing protein [Bacilli bacterium]|jgi:hypothetical protein|nr:glucosaminidase domain-containing protein [Bacilli bacterium]
MEKLPSVKALFWAVIAILLVMIFAWITSGITKLRFQSDISTLKTYFRLSSIHHAKDVLMEKKRLPEEKIEVIQSVLEVPLAVEVVPKIVYAGMTLEELGAKLDRSLKSTLSGYGAKFAALSLEYGVDPYVALAIVLHETGCYHGKCSTLTSSCNNVGGLKGSPGCQGGAYKKFATLDEGIEAFIGNLSKNYYQKGLTTVERIGKKYAESKTWTTKVNLYIEKIKAN